MATPPKGSPSRADVMHGVAAVGAVVPRGDGDASTCETSTCADVVPAPSMARGVSGVMLYRGRPAASTIPRPEGQERWDSALEMAGEVARSREAWPGPGWDPAGAYRTSRARHVAVGVASGVALAAAVILLNHA